MIPLWYNENSKEQILDVFQTLKLLWLILASNYCNVIAVSCTVSEQGCLKFPGTVRAITTHMQGLKNSLDTSGMMWLVRK